MAQSVASGNGRVSVVVGVVDLDGFTVVSNRAKCLSVLTKTSSRGKTYHVATFTAEGGKVECFVDEAQKNELHEGVRGRFIGRVGEQQRIELARFETDGKPVELSGVS